MAENLRGLKVAILVENGFEQEEMTRPREALDRAGAETRIVSPRGPKVRGWKHTEWGDEFPVDVPLDRANAGDFDALLLPGGVMNPDRLRMNPKAACNMTLGSRAAYLRTRTQSQSTCNDSPGLATLPPITIGASA